MSQASVTTNLKANTRNLAAGLKKGKASIASFAKSATSKLGPLGPLLAGAAIIGGITKVIGLINAQEKAEAKLAATLKATGNQTGFTAEQLKKHAAALQQVSTFSDGAIINSQALLATFKNISGDSFERATNAMVDMAAVMDTDVSSGAIQLGKALNDPIKGAAALAEVGVGFTDQQREQIRVMQESGDMMGAQAVILDELEGQFGGAAETMSKTFGGQMAQLQNKLGDLGEKIGKLLIPVLQVLMRVVDFAVDVLMGFSDQIGTVMGWVGKIAAMLKDVLVKAFQVTMGVVVGAAYAMVAAFRSAMDLLVGYFANIGFQVVRLGNQLVWVFTELIPGAVKFLGGLFAALVTFVKDAFSQVGKKLTEFATAVKRFATGGGWDFTWKVDLEFNAKGFEGIKAREEGNLEKTLRETRDNAWGAAGANIAEAYKEGFESVSGGEAGNIATAGGGGRKAAGNKGLDGFTRTDSVQGSIYTKKPGSSTSDSGGVKSRIEGLQALQQRIAVSSNSTSKEDKAAMVAKEHLQVSKEQLREQRRVREQEGMRDRAAKRRAERESKVVPVWGPA